jgi:hypothetical protein
MRRLIVATTLIALVVASPSPDRTSAQVADWYQWRGPNRDGHSAETGLLREWPASGPPRLWQTAGAGTGYKP